MPVPRETQASADVLPCLLAFFRRIRQLAATLDAVENQEQGGAN